MKNFINDESGAITVDWVVLAAGLVAVSIAAVGVIASGVEAGATDVDETLSTGNIIQTSFPSTGPAPYTAFNQTWYNDVSAFYASVSPTEANLTYSSDSVVTENYVRNGNQSDAQIAVDYMRAAESTAAANNITLDEVTGSDGNTFNADAAQAIYDSRFPS